MHKLYTTRTASSALNTRTTVSITQLTVKYDAIKCGTNCLHLWKNYLPLNTYSKLMYVSTLWSCRFVCCFYVCICRRCNFVWACLSVCLSVCLCICLFLVILCFAFCNFLFANFLYFFGRPAYRWAYICFFSGSPSLYGLYCFIFFNL